MAAKPNLQARRAARDLQNPVQHRMRKTALVISLQNQDGAGLARIDA